MALSTLERVGWGGWEVIRLGVELEKSQEYNLKFLQMNERRLAQGSETNRQQEPWGVPGAQTSAAAACESGKNI